MNLCGTFFSSSVMFWCKPGLAGRYLIRIKPPSNDLIHVCIFLGSPSSLKSLTMMSWIKNLSYSFAEASPSFAPNIIIAMVVRPWVPNRVVVWPWIPNIIIATPSLWQGFHVVIHALHNPPGMSSSSICDSMASATATCIRNIDYIKIFINSSLT